jgi:hypothetical protein
VLAWDIASKAAIAVLTILLALTVVLVLSGALGNPPFTNNLGGPETLESPTGSP